MGTTLWFLFVLSIPVFYIKGMISFFSGGKKKSDNSLELFVNKVLATNPLMTVRELMEKYRETNIVRENPLSTEADIPLQNGDQKVIYNDSKSVNNWYSNNSINVLLYVGAFLVVTAAFYFVQFQWSSITGIEKSGIFSIFALMFLILGIVLEKTPKIRTAGITFISIGAVLIPISGIAWYNFVFEPLGVEMGMVWLITSLITIGLYGYLLNKYKYLGCTYALNLAVFSSILSMVNLSRPEMNIYLIASLTYGILMLILARFLATRAQTKLISDPLSSTANILVPLSIFVSVYQELGRFSSLELAYILCLGVVFYSMSYYFSKNIWKLFAGLVMLPLAIVSFFNWREIDLGPELIFLSLLGIGYASLSWLLETKYKSEKEMMLMVGFLITIVATLWTVPSSAMSEVRCWLIMSSGIVSLIAAFSLNRPKFGMVTSVLWAIAIQVFFTQVLNISSGEIVLSGTYMVVAIMLFLLSGLTFISIPVVQSLQYCAIIFGSYGVISSGTEASMKLANLWILAIIVGRVAWRRQLKELIYIAILLFVWGVSEGFGLVGILRSDMPLAYTILGIAIYMLAFGIPDFFKKQLRWSGLLLATIMPFYIGQSFGAEKSAIISFYLATVLFIVDAKIYKNLTIGYLASGLGMMTYLWQIKYLNIDETLAYNLPLGIYFISLGQHRKIIGDLSSHKLLEWVGLGILLLPIFFMAFGDRSIFYSLSLGAVGICLLLSGITISQKNITNAGIAGIVMSILPQTYQYIMQLPRFVFIGAFGLIFLVVAISLLWKRKEE